MPSKIEICDLIWNYKLEKKERVIPNRIFEALKEKNRGSLCLDIGCGDGSFGILASDSFSKIIGLDCSIEAIKKANRKSAPVILADIEKGSLPFKDCTFDLVTCLDVIEHVFNPEEIIKEIYRVLKNNGVLIITTPNIRFIEFIRKLIIEGEFPKTSLDTIGYDGGHIHYFTFVDIKRLLENEGFNIIKERGYDIKNYRSAKILIFKIIVRYWEKNIKKEFFSKGILFKARKK